MSSKDYWAKREREALQHYITDEAEYDKQINKIYTNMLANCQKEINAFYGRYADKEGISIAEAKKRVSSMDIKAYEAKAKRYVKDREFSKQANEEMRLYNATMRINRLEMLKANIGLELIAGGDDLEKFMEGILKGRTEAELKRQAGILGKTITNNAQMVHSIVNASFHNATFSDRIWNNSAAMKADLDKLIQSGLIAGKNANVLAKDLQKYFIGEPRLKNGKKGAKYRAEVLMRTELARVQTEAQKQSFIRNGYTQYQFIVNGNCCDICAGIAGNVFDVEKMMPGENAPPMHPLCRCSTAAYSDRKEYEAWLDYLEKGGTTADWEAKGKAEWEAREKAQTSGRNRSGERVIRKSKADAKDASGVTYEIDTMKEKTQVRVKECYNKLKAEYNSPLKKIKHGFSVSSRKGVKAETDIDGTLIHLANTRYTTMAHEFMHTLAQTMRDKVGLSNDSQFWDEIKSVRRKYNKAVANGETEEISVYAKSSVDEFAAEAFAQYKALENGEEMGQEFGTETTYSKQVVEIIDKYFKKKK